MRNALVLHLPKSRRVLLFDPLKRAIVKEARLDEEGAVLAAGQHWLMVWLPKSRMLERWGLETLTREKQEPLAFDGKVEAMAMGASSTDRLLMVGSGPMPLKGGALVEPGLMRLLPVDGQPDFSGADRVRASAHGHVFTFWSSKGGLRGAALRDEGRLRTHRGPGDGDPAYLVPAQYTLALYGRRDMTGDGGARGVTLEPDLKVIDRGAGVKEDRALLTVFGSHCRLGLNVREKSSRLDVYIGDERQPFASLPDVPLTSKIWGMRFAPDLRALGLAAGKCVVVVPEGEDRLVVYPFDFMERLRDSGQDYLTFVSSPPRGTLAQRGRNFAYSTSVLARSKRLNFRVESGPPGMTISNQGNVLWPIPANFAEREVTVVVSVTNENDRRAEHRFTVRISD